MSNRTIWYVMKTYNETGVYYQTIPYNVHVIYDLLQLKGGFWRTLKFLWDSRWTKKKACRLAEKKNTNTFK